MMLLALFATFLWVFWMGYRAHHELVHRPWLRDAKERGARGAGLHAGMKKEPRADGVTT